MIVSSIFNSIYIKLCQQIFILVFQIINKQKMMQFEKRIIQLFKSFIEKALIPQIKKYDGSLNQWNKFNSIISSEVVNFSDLQLYVDSIPNIPSLQNNEKRQSTLKPKQDIGRDLIDNQGPGFGSKTFGGQKYKAQFIKTDFDELVNQKQTNDRKYQDFSTNPKEDPYKNKAQTIQSAVPSLETLYRVFIDNQQKIESFILPGNGQTQNNRPFN